MELICRFGTISKETSREEVDMTQMQVDWAKHLEQTRHDQAGEQETHRANVTAEKENIRSHKATESIQKSANKETKRANKSREKETHRSNKAQESLTKQAQKETKRHNKAGEIQAKDDLAERKRAAIEANKTTIQSAQISAKGRTDSAAITANANMTSAQISAEAAKYAADRNKESAIIKANADKWIAQHKGDVDKTIANWNNWNQRFIHSLDNQTQKDIAKADQTIKRTYNYIMAGHYNNQDEINEMMANLEKERKEWQNKRDKDQINQNLFDRIMSVLDWLTSGLKVMKGGK